MFKIGAIGAGHMGMAVLEAMAGADILVYDTDDKRKTAARANGFAVAESEIEVYSNVQILLLAVRPQNCEEVVTKLAGLTGKKENPVIVSIISGISSNYIRKYLGKSTAIITIMPTMGMKVNQGAAAIAHTDNVPKDILSYILGIFTATGEAVIVEEPLLKEIVAVNGCMPGYVFYMIDAFARGAKDIDYHTAVRMAARGFIGAATQILEGGDPKALQAEICTPGGLTAKGVNYFEEKQLDKVIAGGMAESIKRGYELSK